MQGNTAVGGREADDTADQWLKEGRECDSGSELQVERNSKKKGKIHVGGNQRAQILRL